MINRHRFLSIDYSGYKPKEKKWQADLPEGFVCPNVPSMEPIFAGRGRVISGLLAARTDLEVRFGTNTKSLRGVIGPISTPIDYLKTVSIR